DFDPAEHRSVFTTDEQTRHTDEHFLTSGDTVRCFFEEDAFDASGELGQAPELSINKIGHAMHDLLPEFDRFSRTAAVAELLTDLGYADPVLLQSMYIFKQPRIGGEVTAHDDHTFLWTEPRSVTGLWFALEDATTENGCLWVLPGGHRHPPRRRFRRDGAGGTVFDELDPDPYPEEGFVPLETTKGTVVVLDGLLPHRSDPNRSDRSRHAYTLHVIERGADYPTDNWLQRPDLPLRGPAPGESGLERAAS
ncbi:MAG: phytanoyl-CoA dioxygenase family protein, partial [Actinomycetota bacterium]